jgi:hypothetical protein
MSFFRIVLARQGEPTVELGTVPAIENVTEWFDGAFVSGLLPNPPKYTDEIQVFEVDGDKQTMKFVWRLSWMQFEARMIV